jgi:hypothetical protein
MGGYESFLPSTSQKDEAATEDPNMVSRACCIARKLMD